MYRLSRPSKIARYLCGGSVEAVREVEEAVRAVEEAVREVEEAV